MSDGMRRGLGRPLQRSFAPVFLALLGLAVFLQPARAHEEPPKTAAEREDWLKRRGLFAARKVKAQHLRVFQPGAPEAAGEGNALLTNRYSEQGDLTEQVVHDPARAQRSVSLYDGNGTWLEELTYKSDRLAERTIFLYGQEGLIRTIQVFDPEGLATETLHYDHRPAADLILLEKRDRGGALVYSIQYSFEPGGAFARQVEAVQKGAGGELRARTRNAFEAGRRVTKEVDSPEGTLAHVFFYTYTAAGDFKEIVRRSPAGEVISRQVFEYRPDGLPAKVTDSDAAGKTTRVLSYSYEFFPSPPAPSGKPGVL